MVIVLDTSAIIDLVGGGSNLVKKLVKDSEDRGQIISVSSVSLFELMTPVFQHNLLRKERTLRSVIAEMQILPFDAQASEESAKIMSGLFKIGKPINPDDVMIAGTAQANFADEVISLDSDFNEIAKVTTVRIRVL
jgi:tRNA(fMet)-specific endonuclease VapC